MDSCADYSTKGDLDSFGTQFNLAVYSGDSLNPLCTPGIRLHEDNTEWHQQDTTASRQSTTTSSSSSLKTICGARLLDGGVARRLTSNLGSIDPSSLSPDGEQLAFIGREEGAAEVYVMPSIGGSARRLTYLSSRCQVIGWNAAGTHILFASNYGQPIAQEMALFQVAADCANGEFEPLPYGPARAVTFGANGETVLGRNTGEPAQWKRYRGGTAGHLWIDRAGDGQFRTIPDRI